MLTRPIIRNVTAKDRSYPHHMIAILNSDRESHISSGPRELSGSCRHHDGKNLHASQKRPVENVMVCLLGEKRG